MTNDQPPEPDFVFFAPLGNAADPKTTAGLADLVQAHQTKLIRHGDKFLEHAKRMDRLEGEQLGGGAYVAGKLAEHTVAIEELERRLGAMAAALDVLLDEVGRFVAGALGDDARDRAITERWDAIAATAREVGSWRGPVSMGPGEDREK